MENGLGSEPLQFTPRAHKIFYVSVNRKVRVASRRGREREGKRDKTIRQNMMLNNKHHRKQQSNCNIGKCAATILHVKASFAIVIEHTCTQAHTTVS